jgi:8-oxo-dGTP pyrophosphatase MutT (NUDIX family)
MHKQIDQSWYKRSPLLPQEISAGGIVARLDLDQVYIALVKEGGLPHYVLPKGHVESGETLEQAAFREIHEEAGLSDLTLLTYLGAQERLSYSKNTWKVIHYFLFLTHQIEGVPTDPHRDYKLKWVHIEELPTMFWPEQKTLIELNRAQIIQFVQHALS